MKITCLKRENNGFIPIEASQQIILRVHCDEMRLEGFCREMNGGSMIVMKPLSYSPTRVQKLITRKRGSQAARDE